MLLFEHQRGPQLQHVVISTGLAHQNATVLHGIDNALCTSDIGPTFDVDPVDRDEQSPSPDRRDGGMVGCYRTHTIEKIRAHISGIFDQATILDLIDDCHSHCGL